MELLILVVFILGYLAIALEHNIKVDKLIPALFMMSVLWAIISLNGMPVFEVDTEQLKLHSVSVEYILLHHLGNTAEILVFLIGAMTIVEIIDYFDGFSTINSYITTKKSRKLLWIVSILAFFLSAIIDNLTATIVLITIMSKLIKERELRLWFAGIIVISANAGGAWSPIGDVTTTMLWIDDKVSALKLIEHVFIPSVVCYLIPLLILSRFKVFNGTVKGDLKVENPSKYASAILYIGLAMIVFVPIFKTITHLPPYIGMMIGLAVTAAFGEIFSLRQFKLTEYDASDTNAVGAHSSPLHRGLSRIEMPSILFFLGILMAVAAMESLGMLFHFAEDLNQTVPMLGTEPANETTSDLVVLLFGFLSAIIDNVPLVAASIGMFSNPTDDPMWHFIAYTAGTGGSMLIIGSAAGVVAMGLEKIDFFWYLKKIAPLALIGYISGAIAFILLRMIIG